MTAALHVYAQQAPHDEAFIVGNREALLALRRAINAALASGQGKADASVADGEGFSIHVILQEGDIYSPEWLMVAVPYTGDWAAEHREGAVWPHDLLKEKERG